MHMKIVTIRSVLCKTKKNDKQTIKKLKNQFVSFANIFCIKVLALCKTIVISTIIENIVSHTKDTEKKTKGPSCESSAQDCLISNPNTREKHAMMLTNAAHAQPKRRVTHHRAVLTVRRRTPTFFQTLEENISR